MDETIEDQFISDIYTCYNNIFDYYYDNNMFNEERHTLLNNLNKSYQDFVDYKKPVIEIVECKCGSKVKKYNYTKHCLSKKHKDFEKMEILNEI